jgi:hypothetical protein
MSLSHATLQGLSDLLELGHNERKKLYKHRRKNSNSRSRSNSPKQYYKEKNLIVEGECSICLDDYNKSSCSKNKKCTHIFHTNCINHWAKLHQTCPTCNVKLKLQAIVSK